MPIHAQCQPGRTLVHHGASIRRRVTLFLRRCREFAWTVLLACLVAFMALSGPHRAEAAQQGWVCPALLMDFECMQYRQRHERAAGTLQHARIEHEFRQLLDERRRACRCSTGTPGDQKDPMSLDILDLQDMLAQVGLAWQ